MTKRSNDRKLKSTNSKRIYDNGDLSTINEESVQTPDNNVIKNDSALSLFDLDIDCPVIKEQLQITYDSEDLRCGAALRLSHLVIVDSVLMETSIDSNLDAMLPFPLNGIYQKFKCSKTYIENSQSKEEFYRGVGLFGIGIEERIYNKRKALEESLKQRNRLRPNSKLRRKLEGSINRNFKKEKVKYNIFTIGTDNAKRNQRQIRKTIKKSSVKRCPSIQKLSDLKKIKNELQGKAEKSTVPIRSIALSRTKRKRKGPQLDFKYCYNDSDGVIRAKRFEDALKEDQFMEIVDSDSSSVVEVSPPVTDKENNEGPSPNHVTSNCVIIPRKEGIPKENKDFNLLDKLRLGLQCSVIQTEEDVIIQNLTVDDLSTLRRRIQGLTTFKNIEAEYDKNGIETARAFIDKRVLNLPLKCCDGQTESHVCGESFKKRMLASIEDKKRSMIGQMDDFCATWVRPKVRFVKKIRKLYTQSASTPNILSRSQTQNRQETTSRSSNKYLKSNDVTNSSPMSFYPQITSVITEVILPELANTPINTEPRSSSVVSSLVATDHKISVTMTTTTMSTTDTTISDSLQRTTSHTMSPVNSGTPATAMSASQLLMLRKGAATSATSGHNTSDFLNSSTSTLSISNNDQLISNQILRPFKKSIVASSPSKLEIDDDEGYPEIHPHAHIGPVSGPGAGTFISTPLVHTASGPRRAIHLPSGTQLPHTILPIVTRLSACSTLPQLVTTSPLPLLANPNSHLRVSSSPLLASVTTSPNSRVKHRKWTHNFLTSNSINFREVLCTPMVSPAHTKVTLHSPAPSTSIVTDTVKSPATAIVTTTSTKSSSVVLKSLLVGPNGTGGTVLWTPKYLSSDPTEESKIKWQVGGSVVVVDKDKDKDSTETK